MAIHNIINNIRIGLCSYKIARAVHKYGFGTLNATPNGIELAPDRGRIIHIGYKNVSINLMPPLGVPGENNVVFDFKRRSLSISLLIKGGEIERCLRWLIEKGPEHSDGILKESGIRVLENSNIKTVEDLALLTSDRLKNQIFCMTDSADKIREAVNDLQIKIFALKAAALLGEVEKKPAVFDDPAGPKNSALSDALLASWAKIKNTIDTLHSLSPTKNIENAEQEDSTVEGLSAYMAEQLNKIHAGSSENIRGIKKCLEKIDRIIADSKTKGHSVHKTKMTINELSGQITILNKYLDEIHVSAKKIRKLIANLIELSIQCRDKALTAALRDELLNKKDAADKAVDQKELLPQISKEMTGKVSILIVDDDPGIRNILQKAFENLGFKVDTAENGLAGLEKFERGDFHLVFSDYSMPVMDGVDFLGTLIQRNKDVPLYIISATPLEIAPQKLRDFIGGRHARFIDKNFGNLCYILMPAVNIAQEKAGIVTTETETAASTSDKPREKPDPLFTWKSRLAHKLNNQINSLTGYCELLSRDIKNDEYLKCLQIEFNACATTIETLKRYAEEFKALEKGDMKLLPYELRNDADVIAAIKELTGDKIAYDKIPKITAAIVVLYMSVLDKLSRLLPEFENNKDKAALNKIISLVKKLKYFDAALTKDPENEEMALASGTIESILRD